MNLFKRLFFASFCFLFINHNLSAVQVVFDYPDGRNTCGQSLLTIRISNNLSQIIGPLNAELRLNNLMSYDSIRTNVQNSFIILSGNKLKISFDTLVQPGAVFIINAWIHSTSACASANCSQLPQASDTLIVKYNGLSEEFVDQSFLKSPCISYDETEFYNRIVSASIGDTIIRRLVLRNTGAGIFSGRINFVDHYRSNIEMDTIYTTSSAVVNSSIFSANSGDSVYTFSASFLNVRNQDSIVVVERVIILKCIEDDEGKSSIFIDWGCGPAACQSINPYPITAQILKDYKKPELAIKLETSRTSDCIDETTHYRYIVKNIGSKKAINLTAEIKFNNINTYSYIVPASVVLSDTAGMFLSFSSFSYDYDNGDQDFDHTCLPVPATTGYKFSFSRLLESDSFTVDLDVRSCCPQGDTANQPLSFEYYPMKIGYYNVCGNDKMEIASDVVRNTDLSWTQVYEPLITDMAGDPYFARDTSSIEISNTGFSADFYKLDVQKSIFKIVIKTDTGLAYVDKNRIYIKSLYGYPLYPFKLETKLGGMADGYQDTIIVASFAFPDTFYVDRNFFRKYFFYSSVVFDLRAYCPASIPQTRFMQEVYFNTDTTCANNCDMLLSSVTDRINVHCPGCIAPGWVAYGYNVLRTTYGEQDDNNDRLPDFSTYAAPDLTKIKRKRYTIGDTVLTELKAYFQDGETGRGKTKFELENNGAQSFKFKYNYLRTNITDGRIYQVNYVKVILTDVDRSAFPSGIDSLIIPKTAVQKIVSANDSLSNATFFYDLSLDTLYKYGLNSSYEYDINDLITVYTSFTILDPSDFYLTPVPDETDPWRLFEESEFRIQNFQNLLFLSGEKYTPPDVAQDANVVAQADPNLLDSTMIYWCEGYGGAANWIGRKPKFTISLPGKVFCKSNGRIEIDLSSGGGSFRNPFPFEYRDLLNVDSIRILIPPGFSIANEVLTVTVEKPVDGVEFEPCKYSSGSFIRKEGSNAFVIYPDSTLITPNQFPGGQCPSQFINGDERIILDMIFNLKADCGSSSGQLPYAPPQVYYTTFPERRNWMYQPALTPVISVDTALLELTPVSNDFQLNQTRYCYPITLEEKRGLDTYHSFIKVVNLSGKLTADTLFSLDNPGTYYLPDTLGVFRLDTLKGSSLNKYHLCLANQCSADFTRDSLRLYFGYDCDTYPDQSFSNICHRNFITHYFQSADLDIQSYLNSPSQIEMCDNIELSYTANITGIGKIENMLVNILRDDLIGIYYKSGSIEYNGTSIRIPDQIINGHQVNLDSSIRILKPEGLVPGDNIKINLSLYTNCLYERTQFRFFMQAVTSSCDTIYDDTLQFLPQVALQYPTADNVSLIPVSSTATNLGGDVSLALEIKNNTSVTTQNDFFIELPLPVGFSYKGMNTGNAPATITDTLIVWSVQQDIISNQSLTERVVLSYDPKNNCDTVFANARLIQRYKTACDGQVCFIQADTVNYFIPAVCTPCPPLLAISDTCKGVPIQNSLHWNNNQDFYCIEDSLTYKVYFSSTEDSDAYSMIYSTSDSVFVHKDLLSYDGCYYVTAVNKNNVESPKSNTVCNKTCVDQFVCGDLFISNLITANKDGHNETFFIKGAYSKLEVEIYNRWGDKILHSLDYKNDFTGDNVEAGIYYFSVTAGNGKYCNGWLQIIR